MADQRAALLEVLQSASTRAECQAAIAAVERWSAKHPDDLEVLATAEAAHRLLAAFDAGLIEDVEARLNP